MAPLSRFGLARGWDTILEIAAVLVTMLVCTAYINHTLQENGRATRRIMLDTYGVIVAEKQLEDTARSTLDDRLNLILKRQDAEHDQLDAQTAILKLLRERQKAQGR